MSIGAERLPVMKIAGKIQSFGKSSKGGKMIKFTVSMVVFFLALDWANKKYSILWDRTDLSSPLHVAANHQGSYLVECFLAALCAAGVCAAWRMLHRID